MQVNSFDVRRIPLLWPVCVWVTGLALVRGDGLPMMLASVLFLLLIVLLLYYQKYLLIVLLFAGALWGATDLMLDARAVAVEESWLAKGISITAVVERVERHKSHSRLLVSQIIRNDTVSFRGKALLYVYGKKRPVFQVGQRIEAHVSWRLPRNYRNPGFFDYKAWCFDQGIALIGSARGEVSIISNPDLLIEQLRFRIRSAIATVDGSARGVLQAILLGERSQLDGDVKRNFSATGAAHLLAISGMHVGMVASCVFVLFWWLLTRREAWIVHLPVRKLALAAGVLVALAYAVIAGLPLPAQRSLFMLTAGVFAWFFATRVQPLNTLLVALLLILMFDPTAVVSLSSGFPLLLRQPLYSGPAH